MTRLNVFADEPWDRTAETMRIRTRFFGLPLGAKELGASLHELLPGSTGFHLHAHYGMEELFFVLSGTPTLRTGDGEEELAPGDVVFYRTAWQACTRSPTQPMCPRACSRSRLSRYPRSSSTRSSARSVS